MAKPAQPTPRLHINLLYTQGLTPKLTVRFIRWLLSYGRIILIVVELMVLSTFAYRFKLDGDLAELKENIEGQVPYIQSLSTDEILIRQTQFKLDQIKKDLNFTPNYQKIVQKLADLTPLGIRFTGLNIDTPQANIVQLSIKAKATSNADLDIFYNSLKTDALFKEVTLTNISLDEGVVVFAITGSLK